MDLDDHLLAYEETPEHIYSLFDYIAYDVKKHYTGKCQIYLIMYRMGFITLYDCTRKIRQCRAVCKQCYKLRNPIVDIILMRLNYRDGEIALSQRTHEMLLAFKWSYNIRRFSIPAQTSLNVHDPRCGRVPLALDIITGYPSLGLYRSCDKMKTTILGCSLHTCANCNYRSLEICRIISRLPLERGVIAIIRKFVFQRVKVGTHICMYTTADQIAASAIYGVCPLELLPCKKLIPTCVKWVSKYSQVCDICMQWKFREAFYDITETISSVDGGTSEVSSDVSTDVSSDVSSDVSHECAFSDDTRSNSNASDVSGSDVTTPGNSPPRYNAGLHGTADSGPPSIQCDEMSTVDDSQSITPARSPSPYN